MTNDQQFVTNPWAFDGSGNNWVEYPHGINSDGKSLQNGLFTTGHVQQPPKGALIGKDAENSLSGGYKRRPNTGFTDQSKWDCCVLPYATPTKEWNASEVAAAVSTQVATFGHVNLGVKACQTKRKAQLKEAALDRSLDAAFRKRTRNTDCLSIDAMAQDYESHWLADESSDPLEQMMQEEERELMLRSIEMTRAALSPDEWLMVLDHFNGMTLIEMAGKFGYSDHSGVRRKLGAIQKKVDMAFGEENTGARCAS